MQAYSKIQPTACLCKTQNGLHTLFEPVLSMYQNWYTRMYLWRCASVHVERWTVPYWKEAAKSYETPWVMWAPELLNQLAGESPHAGVLV